MINKCFISWDIDISKKHYLQIYINVQLLTDQIVNNLSQPVKKHNRENMAC